MHTARSHSLMLFPSCIPSQVLVELWLLASIKICFQVFSCFLQLTRALKYWFSYKKYMPWKMLMLGAFFRIHTVFFFLWICTDSTDFTTETEKKTCLKWQLSQYHILLFQTHSSTIYKVWESLITASVKGLSAFFNASTRNSVPFQGSFEEVAMPHGSGCREVSLPYHYTWPGSPQSVYTALSGKTHWESIS